MNHWLDTSKRNLVPLSKSISFTEALREWLFTGNVYDYDDGDIECELCEHPDLSHHFEIRNTLNDNRLLVGSSCILKFSEITIRDALGQEVTDLDERKFCKRSIDSVYLSQSRGAKIVSTYNEVDTYEGAQHAIIAPINRQARTRWPMSL